MKYKYDKREQRIFKTCGIILTVLLLIAFFTVKVLERVADINTLGVIALLLLYFLPIPVFACWIGYIDSTVYIRKLAAGGVEVPEDKRIEPVMAAPPVYDNEQDSKESLALAVICFIIAGMLLGHILVYYSRWSARVGDECSVLVFAQAVVMLLWCAGGFVYLHQRSAKYYRDDTVFDPGRKVRSSLLKGILTIIIMLAVTAVALSVAHSMTRYLYRTRLETKYGEHWREHDGELVLPGEVYD